MLEAIPSKFRASLRDVTVFVVLLAAGLIVFRTGLRAGFLSDTFIFVEISETNSFTWALRNYIPEAGTWYRPTTELVFWLEVRLFGDNPLLYHLFVLLMHVTSSFLIYLLSVKLSGPRISGWVAAGIFLVSVHAQEVVFDIADLHNAIGGVALLATILAYVYGRKILAVGLMVITLTIDESGLLIVVFVGFYELVFAYQRPLLIGQYAKRVAVQTAPFIAVAAAYFLFRIGVTQAEIYNETATCRSASCLKDAGMDYINRLLVRADRYRFRIFIERDSMFAFSLLVGTWFILLLRPWGWRDWRPILFATGWIIASVLFYILSLYPYVADRFVYVPDTGFALLIGFVAGESYRNLAGSSWAGRLATAAAAGIAIAWVAASVSMLSWRGTFYTNASREADRILANTVAIYPDPPSYSTIQYNNIPRLFHPQIPPGNTGPFLFHNGLASALRLEYGRHDLFIIDGDRLEEDVNAEEITIIRFDDNHDVAME